MTFRNPTPEGRHCTLPDRRRAVHRREKSRGAPFVGGTRTWAESPSRRSPDQGGRPALHAISEGRARESKALSAPKHVKSVKKPVEFPKSGQARRWPQRRTAELCGRGGCRCRVPRRAAASTASGSVRGGRGGLDALQNDRCRQHDDTAGIKMPKAPRPGQVACCVEARRGILAVPGQPRLPGLDHLASRAIRLAAGDRLQVDMRADPGQLAWVNPTIPVQDTVAATAETAAVRDAHGAEIPLLRGRLRSEMRNEPSGRRAAASAKCPLLSEYWGGSPGAQGGGETGIRTLETVSRLHAFQACAFDHSATSPASAP